MRNIRLFNTFDEFVATQESVSGSGQYVEDIIPGFAYVRERYPEEKYAIYNGEGSDGDYEFGDVVYYADNELKKVYWTGYTESMGTPVGLIVVPTSMAPDGNARMIAFTDITEPGIGPIDPIKGEENRNTKDGLRGEEDIPVSYYWDTRALPTLTQYYYDGYAIQYEYEEEGGHRKSRGASDIRYTCETFVNDENGYMSTDFSFSGQYYASNPIADGEYYFDEPMIVSPYMADNDGINPSYLQEEWTIGSTEKGGTSYNALSDFSGLTWTKMLADVAQEAYVAAQLFTTSGTNAGDWYIPSVGEAGFISSRLNAIMGILSGLQMFNKISMLARLHYTSTLGYNINKAGQPRPCIICPQNVSSSPLTTGTTARNTTLLGTSYPSDIPVLPNIFSLNPILTTYYVSGGGPKSIYTEFVYVRPMAMIKGGHIVTEVGTPVANGHQVSDLLNINF